MAAGGCERYDNETIQIIKKLTKQKLKKVKTSEDQ
jgi:hypothetical protein